MAPRCVFLLLLLPQLVFFKAFLLFFILLAPQYFAIADEQFSACWPFSCGNITNLTYPFWSDSRPQYCGHPSFKLDCQGYNATINMASQNFRVLDVHSTKRTLIIARMDLWGTKCTNEFHNTTLDYDFFSLGSDNVNSTILYDCDSLDYTSPRVNLSTSMKFDCPIYGDPRQAYFLLIRERWFNWTAVSCGIGITVPVLGSAAKSFMGDPIDPVDVIGQGFEVKWELIEEERCEGCRNSGGRCGYDVSFGGFTCLCPNQSYYQQNGFCFLDQVGAPTPEPLLQPQSMFSSSFIASSLRY